LADTFLIIASKHGQLEVVKYLLNSQKFDLDEINEVSNPYLSFLKRIILSGEYTQRRFIIKSTCAVAYFFLSGLNPFQFFQRDKTGFEARYLMSWLVSKCHAFAFIYTTNATNQLTVKYSSNFLPIKPL
jgi:hypothetical protein